MVDIFLRVDTEKGTSSTMDDVVVSGTILSKSCKIVLTGNALKFISKIFIDTAIEGITQRKIESVVSLISDKSGA